MPEQDDHPKQMTIRERIQEFLRIRSPRRMYFYAVIVGIIAGLAAVVFSYGLAYAESFLLHDLAGLQIVHPPGEIAIHHDDEPVMRPILVLLLPILGGLAVGIILQFFFSETSGAGTDDMVRAFHRREGRIKGRAPFYKMIGTILTLSSGGSGGREGPTAFVGAGIGTWIGRLVNAGPRARRTLLLAGTAAGLGAIFRAPLGGAIVAMEILYLEDIESDSLVPCIISSVTGFLVFQWIAGPGPLFEVSEFGLNSFRELVVYFVLGLVCYCVGFVYVKFFHEIRRFFQNISVPLMFKPALGGAVVGTIMLFVPQVGGSGMGFLQQLMSGASPAPEGSHMLTIAGWFFLLAVLKICTTSFSIGSGGSGGVFAPSLFIGAMLGGAVASLAQFYLPGWGIELTPFMIVGMGAFFAGVARAPFAAMIMVSDIIGSYTLLPPLMIVSMIALILSHRWSIYREQLRNRFQSPAHFWDMRLDVLNQLVISEEFSEYRQSAIIRGNRLLAELDDLAFDTQASDFVVRSAQGTYAGMISLKKVRVSREERENLKNLVTVEDACEAIPAVSEQASLAEALKIITEHDYDKVAIVSPEGSNLLGYIRYHDIFHVYHQQLNQVPADSEDKDAERVV